MGPLSRRSPLRWQFALLLGLVISPLLSRAEETVTEAASEPSASDKAPSATSAEPKSGGTNVPDYGFKQVALINRLVRQGWTDHKLTPAAPATDGEWVRRVFLDVLGRIPTASETERYLRDSRPQRKVELVNRLLGAEYQEEYARHWTTVWTQLLIGRSGGKEPRNQRLTNRAGLEVALHESFAHNLRYDQLVSDLLTAKGANAPDYQGTDAKFNGFVNFLSGKLADKGIQATAKTAQLFLGMQVQCTQCHNHPFNDWKQNQFWELNAFFRQTRALRRFEKESRDIKAVVLDNEDFAGEDDHPQEATLFYELRNGLTKAALPVFVDGRKPPSSSGWVSDCDRRQELAKFVIDSEFLAPTQVNRAWAHFFGYGFTRPIDDMGPHNAASHPELLQQLAQEFKQSDYNLKELIRWIVLSHPYGLSSKYGYAPTAKVSPSKRSASSHRVIDDPTLGETPWFSHFYLRQLPAEALFQSLVTATQAQRTWQSPEEQAKAQEDLLAQFVLVFGTDENDEATTFNGTIPQSLLMWNGELIKKATSTEKGSFLHSVAEDTSLDNAGKIRRLYLAALSRVPTRKETQLANELLVSRKGDAIAALQDVWWAVLNSNEFIFNH